MADHDRQPVIRALLTVEGLSRDEAVEIAALGLPIYESMAIGYLRTALRLFERDAALGADQRVAAWSAWSQGMREAVDGAMRYRENQPLIIAMGVLSALIPGLFPHASLRGFTALEEAIKAAQKQLSGIKRERAAYHPRLKDILVREQVWIGPAGEIRRGAALPAAEREALAAAGWHEVWGIHFDYFRPEEIVRLVAAVLPVAAQTFKGGGIVAAPGGET